MPEAVQVYEGDGLSERERLEQALWEAERQARLDLLAASRPKTLKMKFTKEAMEDLQTNFPLDLEGELLKDVDNSMIENAFDGIGIKDVQKDKAIWTEDMLKVFGLTKEMLK